MVVPPAVLDLTRSSAAPLEDKHGRSRLVSLGPRLLSGALPDPLAGLSGADLLGSCTELPCTTLVSALA